MPTFKKLNANYYNNNISDCVIRAISFGCNIGYKKTCELFDKTFIDGLGMGAGGISKTEIDKFAKKYDFIKYYDGDTKYLKWFNRETEDFDINFGLPVFLWMEEFKGKGKYIVVTRKPTMDRNEADKHIHCIYVNCNSQTYFDTWDSGDELIFCVYKIEKILQNSDKFSRTSEFNEIFRKTEKHS